MEIFIYALETIYKQEYSDTMPMILGFAIKFRSVPSEDEGMIKLEGQIDVYQKDISFNEAKEIVLKKLKG